MDRTDILRHIVEIHEKLDLLESELMRLDLAKMRDDNKIPLLLILDIQSAITQDNHKMLIKASHSPYAREASVRATKLLAEINDVHECTYNDRPIKLLEIYQSEDLEETLLSMIDEW